MITDANNMSNNILHPEENRLQKGTCIFTYIFLDHNKFCEYCCIIIIYLDNLTKQIENVKKVLFRNISYRFGVLAPDLVEYKRRVYWFIIYIYICFEKILAYSKKIFINRLLSNYMYQFSWVFLIKT